MTNGYIINHFQSLHFYTYEYFVLFYRLQIAIQKGNVRDMMYAASTERLLLEMYNVQLPSDGVHTLSFSSD